ncbi:CD109 antigen-like [Sphaeramia orbicularis]|uniref:CD109 antigen-like n=1 Tax=Sphaeramia orbicularis TaxID=375764 RepID=UPI00117D196F|nr:CD109 antigen-like [Sphaeramia orbicularis]
MAEIWILVLCLGVVGLAVPGSTQQSSSALFVISGPEVLYVGTPTPLAVTVLANFTVRVTAEATQGNIKVSQTEDFAGGLTGILTLPSIDGSVTQGSPVDLTVKGYKEDELIFTNTTSLTFDLRNISTFVQTDKSHYQPEDTVKVRVVVVQLDNHPYKGEVDIVIQDPSGRTVDSGSSTGNHGIVLREFRLSQTASLGQWKVTATVNGVEDEKTFIVENNEVPPFEVLIKTLSNLLTGDNISGSVRALYLSGQPVHGTLAVSVTSSSTDDSGAPFMRTQTKEIYGSAQFFFSKYELQVLNTMSDSGHVVVHVTVVVTDNSTITQGLTVSKTVEVHLRKNSHELSFHGFPQTLKPSLHFSTQLKISRSDTKALTATDLTHSAVIEITQRTSTISVEPTSLTLPVPEDGNVHIRFQLQAQVETVFIHARYQSNEVTLQVHKNQSSPSGSYIQVSPISPALAQIGSPLQINVESTFTVTQLHFLVISRGQVVAAGTKTSSSFSLTPTLSWSPEACVTVYHILSDGEVISDTANIPVNQHTNISLNWSSNKAQPGEQVTLSVTVPEMQSQVGIVIMRTHDAAADFYQELTVEQECNIRILTNTRLYDIKHLDGSQQVRNALSIERYWSLWMDTAEPLLWLDATVSGNEWTSEEITVPDGVPSLRAAALVMSDNLGLGFTPIPKQLTVSKDFSLSLNVPSYVIRQEETVLEVNIINHLEQDLEVILLIAQSDAFEFVLENRGDFSVVNAQKLTLGSHAAGSALFPIKPVALGEIEISVDAVSAEASESLVWRVLVKPEGVEESFSQSLFLEVPPFNTDFSTSISFSLPPHVVPDSLKAYVALGGDILALSISKLDSLVPVPVGCGEQNMIHFAPSIYILQYLDKTNDDDIEIRSKALSRITEGYQKQLSFRRNDGSFSPFGASDSSGNIWLTAFVLRCFIQAQAYMQVDQSVLTQAMTWLLEHQGPNGEFNEVGQLMNTEIQGGLDNGPVALTAYVLIALLEDQTLAERYEGNVSKAQRYLENQASTGVVSNYSLCLMAYALSLAYSPEAQNILEELKTRAEKRDGAMMWRSSAGVESHGWQPRSAQVEMTSYLILTFFKRGSFLDGIDHLKWLSKQRSFLGGYGTTQDTVVALQALATYAAFSGAKAINLSLNMSSQSPSFASLFRINGTSYRTYQSQEVNLDKDVNISIHLEGRGFATFQINLFYNLESQAFTQNLRHMKDNEAFSLNVELINKEQYNHMLLSICMKLKDSEAISQTGMAILDVGMLSGIGLSPGAAAPSDLIRKVEKLPEKIILYLDSINKTQVCIKLPLVRVYKVARVQDALVHLYDYYEPTRRTRRTYNLDVLHNMDSCVFCGENCEHCRPGVSIMVSPATVSRSIISATYSLTCLFVSAFLIVA